MAINFDRAIKRTKGNKYIFTIGVIKRAKELFSLYPSPQKSPVSFIELAAKDIEEERVEITKQ